MAPYTQAQRYVQTPPIAHWNEGSPVDMKSPPPRTQASPKGALYPFAFSSQACKTGSMLSRNHLYYHQCNGLSEISDCVFINIIGSPDSDIFSICVFINIMGLSYKSGTPFDVASVGRFYIIAYLSICYEIAVFRLKSLNSLCFLKHNGLEHSFDSQL